MGYWAGVVTEGRFTTERLYARDLIEIERPTAEPGPADGDLVALIAATDPPVVFGLGQVIEGSQASSDAVLIQYRRRALDEPSPAITNPSGLGLTRLLAVEYAQLVRTVEARAGARTEWFVSVALPIEAATRAEAVREFWTYVEKLGPRELPAYVWPRGDELAMQAFVLGAVANLDPEEDEGA